MNTSAEQRATDHLEPLLSLSREEIKSRVRRGTLLAPLRQAFRESGREDCLISVTPAGEKYERESSFLLLNLEFKAPSARLSYQKELILQFLEDEDDSGGPSIRSWYYPEDPELPGLFGLVASPACLEGIEWNSPGFAPFQSGEERFIRRLLYNPGRRVTFLLGARAHEKRRILKIVRRKEFQEDLDKSKAIKRSGIHQSLTLPQLISYSPEKCFFLYDYLPGLRVDQLGAERFGEIKPLLYDEVIEILSKIHQTAIPALPQWAPQIEIGMMSCSEDHLHARFPKVSGVIRPLFERLSELFVSRGRSYSGMIHGSFSPKHLLYDAERFASSVKGKLAVIDWDSAALGPREKDIGSFLAGFPGGMSASLDFIQKYEKKTCYSVDLELLNGFMQFRRLMKHCRKLLRGSEPDPVCLELIKEIGSEINSERRPG